MKCHCTRLLKLICTNVFAYLASLTSSYHAQETAMALQPSHSECIQQSPTRPLGIPQKQLNQNMSSMPALPIGQSRLEEESSHGRETSTPSYHLIWDSNRYWIFITFLEREFYLLIAVRMWREFQQMGPKTLLNINCRQGRHVSYFSRTPDAQNIWKIQIDWIIVMIFGHYRGFERKM